MMMQFFSKLSQNFIELLEDDEYYDIIIEVGEDPNVKIFRAHTSILCYRSPYLRKTLASIKKNNSDLTHIRLPNISPETFQIILRYIYGGIISLNKQDTSEMLKVLVAADMLLLQELVDYLQKYFVENESEWMELHFELTHRTSFQSNNLSELQKFCTDFMVKSPERIFKSLDFTSLTEKSLISLIKRDDLQMKEVVVWDHVLKWGLAKNPTLISDPDTWMGDDFKTMENTLQHCLSLIRFFSLSSKEFLCKIRPYRKLLKQQLYEELLGSYLDSDIKPSDDISLPRHIKIDETIESNIVNLNIISIISRWIDRMDINSKYSYLRELYLPYKFELLLRGSRNGFTPRKFHELCDDRPNTITFIKVIGTGEILGGYNPSIWKSTGGWSQSYSFIFSFKNKDKFDDSILSHVKNMDRALCYNNYYGPSFGGTDLELSVDLCSVNFNYNICKKNNYEKKIRDTEDEFVLEDYEIFQIVKK